jgi:hypothetical protein
LRFGCLDKNSMAIADQVATMKVSDWSNQWTKVFDFTENPPTMHWGFLPETCPDLSKQTVLEECWYVPWL